MTGILSFFGACYSLFGDRRSGFVFGYCIVTLQSVFFSLAQRKEPKETLLFAMLMAVFMAVLIPVNQSTLKEIT